VKKNTVLKMTFIFIAAISIAVSAGIIGAEEALTPVQELGEQIFFDMKLSIGHNQSCASCHTPEWGWTGPDSTVNNDVVVYEGSIKNDGRFGDRKPPSAAYATQSPIFHFSRGGLWVGGNFWDGRATGEKLGNPAADQAQGPFLNPVEQGLCSLSGLHCALRVLIRRSLGI